MAVPTPFDAALRLDEEGPRANLEAMIPRGVRTGSCPRRWKSCLTQA